MQLGAKKHHIWSLYIGTLLIGASLGSLAKGFPIDFQLQTAAWLAHSMFNNIIVLKFHVGKDQNIFISGMSPCVCESVSPQSVLYITPEDR